MAYEEIYASGKHAVRTFQGDDADKANVPVDKRTAGTKYLALDTGAVYIYSEYKSDWVKWA
jgi:hypothetical protein